MTKRGGKRNGAINRKIEQRTNQKRTIATNISTAAINGSPNIIANPEIDKIPTNETGTFIENITVGCSFCKQRFDRPDEYKLHHGEKHSKHGMLPDQPINISQEANINNASNENSIIAEIINNSAPIRKRRPSCAPGVSYLEDEINTSSSDSDTSDDDDGNDGVKDKSPENTDIPLQEPMGAINEKKANSSECSKPKRKRKRSSSKSKERDSSSSSDSSLENDIQNTVNKFVKNLSKKLMKHLKSKIIKEKKDQKKKLYKCNKCSLHFLKMGKLLKHLKRDIHTEMQQVECDLCKLKFTKKTLQKHMKLHIKNGRPNKNIKFKIVTKNDSSFYNSDNSSTSENSESDNEAPISAPISEPVNSVHPVEENSKPEKEIVENQITTNLKINAKKSKKILYKCDDCEEHFLTRANAVNHTKNSTHHRMGKNTTCNQCTYKFSSRITLSQHERLHHSNPNLTKDDFKVITLFGPDRTRTLNPKRKISHEIQKKNLNKKHKIFKEPIDRALLFRCEGCDLTLTSKPTLLKHIRTCEGKMSRKYQCQKCQLYFITIYTLARHAKVHDKYPLLKKEDFMIISRKPRNNQISNVPQSNIVSTTEGNVDNSLTEQDHSKKNVSENDICKVKLSKSTENCWCVVPDNEKCKETLSSMKKHENPCIVCNDQLDINKTVVPATSVQQNFNLDNNIIDHPNTMVENGINLNSTNNLISHKSNTISNESTNNIDSTNNEDTVVSAATSVGISLEQNSRMVVVKSAYLEKPDNEITANIKKEFSKDNEDPKANKSDGSMIENLHFGIKPEHCEQHEKNLQIKNEILKKEIKADNDLMSETQNNVSNSTSIKIANSYSMTLKFEDSDSQNSYQKPSSSQNKGENDAEFTDSQNPLLEIKIECNTLTDVKKNIIKPENSYTDDNIMNGVHNNIIDAQKSEYHSEDSQNTLMLVDDDDQIDELADDHLDDTLDVIYPSENNKSYPAIAIPINIINSVNKSTEYSKETVCNVIAKDSLNELTVANRINHNDDQEKINDFFSSKTIKDYKSITEDSIGQSSTVNFVNPSFRVRDRRESDCEVKEDSHSNKNELKTTTISSIKEEPVTNDQNQNRKVIKAREQVENQEVFEISDDDEDAVVPVYEKFDMVDLTG